MTYELLDEVGSNGENDIDNILNSSYTELVLEKNLENDNKSHL